MGVEKLVAVGRYPHISCQGQHPELLFSSICVWGEAQGQGIYYVEQSTQNPSVVFCIFRIPSRIWDLIEWVVTDCVLSSSYHLHAVCSAAVVQLYNVCRVTTFLRFFKELLVMSIKNLHLYSQWFPFSLKTFSSEGIVDLPAFVFP